MHRKAQRFFTANRWHSLKRNMKLTRYFIALILLIISFSCSQTKKRKLITDSLSDSLNIVLIDAKIDYDKDKIIPLTRNNVNSNFSFCPQCPFWHYDSIENKAIIYSKFTKANLNQINTLILIKYKGLFNKLDYGMGYLYDKDTLPVKSIGLLGKNTFRLISNNNELFMETNFQIQNNVINAEYYGNFDLAEKVRFIEEYKYKLIKNVGLEIKTDGYECE